MILIGTACTLNEMLVISLLYFIDQFMYFLLKYVIETRCFRRSFVILHARDKGEVFGLDKRASINDKGDEARGNSITQKKLIN